jgi:HAD superfamily hydrolase (TIGR01490 family)
MSVAFFDMDRTLITVNSGTRWVRFLRRRGEISRWQLMRAFGWAVQYHLSILDMASLSQKLVASLQGEAEADMLEKCAVWYADEMRDTIARPARARVEEHRARGERVVLLTGATQYIAEPIARATEIADVICSRLEVKDGRFTGRVIEPVCFGAGKVAAAEAWAERNAVDLAATTFYTDSYTDLPMLERVGRPVAVNPDPRLAREARRRGWPILDWLAGA